MKPSLDRVASLAMTGAATIEGECVHRRYGGAQNVRRESGLSPTKCFATGATSGRAYNQPNRPEACASRIYTLPESDSMAVRDCAPSRSFWPILVSSRSNSCTNRLTESRIGASAR